MTVYTTCIIKIVMSPNGWSTSRAYWIIASCHMFGIIKSLLALSTQKENAEKVLRDNFVLNGVSN